MEILTIRDSFKESLNQITVYLSEIPDKFDDEEE